MSCEPVQTRPPFGWNELLKKLWCATTFCMSLGAWCYSWIKIMWFCKAMVWDRDRDIFTRAPLAGQLIGLVMTNILGAIHFSRAEDRVGVILAIFDLDVWLLAFRHGPGILKGEAPRPWEKLRLRNAIWRGMPLACIDYYLVSRDMFEIPICHLAAALRVELVRAGHRDASPFWTALNRSRIDPLQLNEVQTDSWWTSTSMYQLETLASLLLVENAIWHSCLCNKCIWERRRPKPIEDMLQNYPHFQLVNGNDNNFYGQSWYCNLFAINVKLHDEFCKRLRREDRKLRKQLRELA
ncbi:unnamed protein product [Effrenium voratum]|nr:unnamed protein product [Effrenium voratum]